MSTIQFIECQRPGYPARTEENIINSQATIAIANDFSTAGERLTRRLCVKHQKLYIPIELGNINNVDLIRTTANLLSSNNITKINGAGNGIYGLPYTQLEVSVMVGTFLALIQGILAENKILSVCSGGQTGIDEAFLIAALGQYIPEIICRAPKGWGFRTKNHRDLYDEVLFKKRFDT